MISNKKSNKPKRRNKQIKIKKHKKENNKKRKQINKEGDINNFFGFYPLINSLIYLLNDVFIYWFIYLFVCLILHSC
jgi:hypothetical protein